MSDKVANLLCPPPTSLDNDDDGDILVMVIYVGDGDMLMMVISC